MFSTNANTYTEKIESIVAQISSGLFEKENSVRLVFLSFISGESTFLLGEPGTAKSLIARRVAEAFEEPTHKEKEQGVIKFFDYLMSRFSQPDELFGPVSIKHLKEDIYERKTEYYLPKAQFAFLDEIWKANPAIQNALLTILNEHLFRNGKALVRVPLIGFVSASNELPAKGQGLEAIFDRFLIRIHEQPVQDEQNFFEMISGKSDMTISLKDRLSAREIEDIRQGSESVTLSKECQSIIATIRKLLTLKNEEPNRDETEKYVISDRRWKKIAQLMRVSAFCNGRKDTDFLDATLIADCIWSTESQEKEVLEIVLDAIFDDTETNALKKRVQEFEDEMELSVLSQQLDSNNNLIIKDLMSRKQEIEKQLEYCKSKTNVFVCEKTRQKLINPLQYQRDTIERLIEKSFDLGTKLITPSIAQVRLAERRCIEDIIRHLIKPIIRNDSFSQECYLFKSQELGELFIPISFINDIFSDTTFHMIKQHGNYVRYQYDAKSLKLTHSLYAHKYYYDLCLSPVDHAVINNLIAKAKASLDAEFSKHLNTMIATISNDGYLVDEIKKDFIKKSIHKPSYSNVAKARMNDIEQRLVSKQSAKEICDYLRSLLDTIDSNNPDNR